MGRIRFDYAFAQHTIGFLENTVLTFQQLPRFEGSCTGATTLTVSIRDSSGTWPAIATLTRGDRAFHADVVVTLGGYEVFDETSIAGSVRIHAEEWDVNGTFVTPECDDLVSRSI